eukprot:scaffold23116_cov103-Isochrysis_galbana.AAC.8
MTLARNERVEPFSSRRRPVPTSVTAAEPASAGGGGSAPSAMASRCCTAAARTGRAGPAPGQARARLF